MPHRWAISGRSRTAEVLWTSVVHGVGVGHHRFHIPDRRAQCPIKLNSGCEPDAAAIPPNQQHGPRPKKIVQQAPHFGFPFRLARHAATRLRHAATRLRVASRLAAFSASTAASFAFNSSSVAAGPPSATVFSAAFTSRFAT